MDMITPEDVIRRIELYHSGEASERQDIAAQPERVRHPAKTTPTKQPVPQRAETNKPSTARTVVGVQALACPMQPKGCTPAGISNRPRHNVLIRFRHGLGAAIQLQSVLRHLKHYHPDWNVDVAAPVGKHTAFFGLCRHVFVLGEHEKPGTGYDRVHVLNWEEPDTCYAKSPSTSAEHCLATVFRLSPIADLCTYAIEPDQQAFDRAREYLEDRCKVTTNGNGRYPVVLIHYEGNTWQDQKNLPVDVARHVCEEVIRAGATPVILDWDERTPLADGRRIYNPGADDPLWGGIGTGDAAVLAALTELSMLMIGVNSGPLHIAGATSTPTIGVWTRQHPLHYFGHAGNVIHLVPKDHTSRLRGDHRRGEAYFKRHYTHRVYEALESALSGLISERLQEGRRASLIRRGGFWIRNDNSQQDLVVVQDVVEKDAYHMDELPGSPQVVVDVGAHIVKEFCNSVIRRGMVPVILDWDYRSPLPDGKRIHNPNSDSNLWGGMGTGDAEVLAALIEASSLLVGVDSGPLHVAGATTTPTVGVWTRHHPLHYMGLADNVVHLVPRDHARLLRGDPDVGLVYFEDNYQFEVFGRVDELPAVLECHIPELNSRVRRPTENGLPIVTRSVSEETGILADASGYFNTATRVKEVAPPAVHKQEQRSTDTEARVEAEDAPIFVSGYPRSGTTWMQWFLSQHPDIHIHGQLPNLDWQPGWQWYQQLLECGRWAERANERVGYEVPHYAGSDERRCRQLFATLIRDFLTGFAPPKRRWGIKSLTWCMTSGLPEQVESLWPEPSGWSVFAIRF